MVQTKMRPIRDTIPLDDLKKNAVIMAVFVYHAAIAEDVLPRTGSR